MSRKRSWSLSFCPTQCAGYPTMGTVLTVAPDQMEGDLLPFRGIHSTTDVERLQITLSGSSAVHCVPFAPEEQHVYSTKTKEHRAPIGAPHGWLCAAITFCSSGALLIFVRVDYYRKQKYDQGEVMINRNKSRFTPFYVALLAVTAHCVRRTHLRIARITWDGCVGCSQDCVYRGQF